jgi:cell division septation protein DedD
MKDPEMSEKDLSEDMDKMHERVADIEKEEAAEAPMPEKEKPKPKEKRSSRPIVIIALIVCIILAGILAFPSLKEMIAPLLSKKSETPPPFVATPSVPKAKPPAPPPVPKEQEPVKIPAKEVEKAKPVPPPQPPTPKEQEAMKILPKEAEKTKPVPQEITKSAKPLSRKRYYTIQAGAFHNLEYARERLVMLQRDGLDAYLTKFEGKKRGTFYRVFVGHFKDEKEGTRFLKEKGILINYPGSFVRKEPSFELNQLIEGKISL